MRKLSCLFLSLALTHAVRGDILLHEPFDYPDGLLATVSGGVWQRHSSSNDDLFVVAGRAELSGARTDDLNALLAGQPYSANSVITLFAGFTLRFTSLPSSSSTYFVHFKDTGTGYRARVHAFTAGAAAGSFRLGIANWTGSASAFPQDLSLNTDYRVVMRYVVNTGSSTLWLNPQSASDPSINAADSPSTGTVTSFALRQNTGMGNLTVDDLIVATTFEEALGVEPPPQPPPAVPALSVLTYNLQGNSVEDWSTNSAQVQAIGRQMQALDPDIITFQEIPLNQTWQMTNFVKAFRPGYALAANSATDGFIRSVILSRYPIVRSTSWMGNLDLKPFGYTNANPNLNRFTRDLFEAEIAVPGFALPVHVFTTHLKALSDPDSTAKRAAEAGAISNFFVTAFLTTNSQRAYVLTGDLNEDIAIPPSGSGQPIQRLTSPPTGLRLTTPLNPFTLSERTWSIQWVSLTRRFDYILPGGMLFSNIVSSQVFRTDQGSPPPPALAGDSVTASDHLPVLMSFANPYDAPFRILSVDSGNNQVSLSWESLAGQRYAIEGAAQPGSWTVVASNLVATGAVFHHNLNLTSSVQLLRIKRVP